MFQFIFNSLELLSNVKDLLVKKVPQMLSMGFDNNPNVSIMLF